MRREVATYDYRTANGEVLFQVVRYEPKGFAQRRPNGSGGWTWDRNGVRPVLYRLPDLRADQSATVFLPEGEKDADCLHRHGLLATTNPGGAGRWDLSFSVELRNRRIVVLPDNDETGLQHAELIARSLTGTAAEVRVLLLPGLPPKGDVSDWLDGGGTVEDLDRLANLQPVFDESAERSFAESAQSEGNKAGFQTARQFAAATPQRIAWVARPWVATGAITELDGRPKAAGKSTFLAFLIRAVVDGEVFLNAPTAKTPVVLLSEQPPASLRETLARAALLNREDLSLLIWRDVRGRAWPEIVAAAVAECHRIGSRLLVVDTLPRFAQLLPDSENDSGAALQAMEPLQTAAAEGLAIVVSRHDRKGGGEVGESGRGSSAFAGAVDIVLALRRGDGESRPTIRHLHALSRFDQTPEEVVIELTDRGYVSLGLPGNFAVEEAKRAVLSALSEKPMTLDDLVEATGLGRTSVSSALGELVDEGRVVRHGRGVRGDPYEYSLAKHPPSGTYSQRNRSGRKQHPRRNG